MNLLKSEKQVLVVNEFTGLKVIFTRKNGEPIEDDNYYSVKHVEALLNLMGGLIKNNLLPIKGDVLDTGRDRLFVLNRYFEMENNLLMIIYDLTNETV